MKAKCNVCARRRCKEHNQNPIIGCSSYTAPKPFRVKLFQAALATNPQSVHDVLSAFKMRIQELDRKPYFRILLTEML